jgi:hypothetical protein
MKTLPYASALVLVAGLMCAGPADAQPRWGARGQYGYDHERAARDNGYREGYADGQRDARSGRRFDDNDARAYRDADIGYDGRAPRGQYRQVFRDSFRQGYRDGYYGSSSGYGRAIPRRDSGYGYPSGRYPDYGRYPENRRYPESGGGYYSQAYDRGRSDGYEKGLDDGRHNRRFDPVGEKWYREGDRGYNGRYGSREQYKVEYRDAFRQGYEQGYRDAGGYGNGRYPDRSGGWRWPF